jgi:hypothetical protein
MKDQGGCQRDVSQGRREGKKSGQIFIVDKLPKLTKKTAPSAPS